MYAYDTIGTLVGHTDSVLLEFLDGSHVAYYHFLLLVGTAPEPYSVTVTVCIPQSFSYLQDK